MTPREKNRWARLNARLQGWPLEDRLSHIPSKCEPKRLRMKYSTWMREKQAVEARKQNLASVCNNLSPVEASRMKIAIDRREKRLAEAEVIMKGNW